MRRPTYSACLMNDTKWREVLLIAMRMRVQFEVAYVEREEFQMGAPVAAELLGEHTIADPGIAGGPAEYRDIYAIRFNRYVEVRNPRTGARTQDEGLSASFLAEINSLGALPIEILSDYIYVRGYGERAKP